MRYNDRSARARTGRESNKMRFKDKVAVVTGGGSGIGRACAFEFAAGGAHVAVVDCDAASGERVAGEITGSRAAFFRADLSLAADAERAMGEAVKRFGGIDILVNNAGIQRYGNVATLTEAEWDEVLNANLKSAFLASKFAIPEMIRRGGGAVVITGSVQSVTAQRNSAHYVVSKHGLLGLARSIAIDFAKDNIRANCVLPGAIDTPMLRWAASLDPHPERVIEACNHLHALGRMGKPEEVARVIAFLASDEASFMTGSAVMVDGGLLTPAGGMAFQESGTGSTKA